MKTRFKKIVQLGISAAIFGILLYYIDFEQLKGALSNAKPGYLFVCLGLIALNRTLMPVKWNLLLRAQNLNAGWLYTIKIYYISSFLGFFLPPTIGADMIRVYYLHRKNNDIAIILSSIVLERLIGFITLIFFGIIGCVLLTHFFVNIDFDVQRIFLVLTICFLVFVLLFWISFSDKVNQLILCCLQKFENVKILRKIDKTFNKFYTSYRQYKLLKGTVFLFTLLTCVEITLPILRAYFVAKALNSDIPLKYFFAFLPVILLLIRLPISFDGFGIQEGGFAYFLSLAGATVAEGFSIGLVNHLFFILGIFPGGLFYLTEKIDKKGSTYLEVSSKSQIAR